MAFTFWPWIIGTDYEKRNEILMNHEKIHLVQQREMFVIPFYFAFYISSILVFLRYWNVNKAYRANMFELEAFYNMYDMTYLNTRQRFSCWKKNPAIDAYKKEMLAQPTSFSDRVAAIMLAVCVAAFTTVIVIAVFFS